MHTVVWVALGGAGGSLLRFMGQRFAVAWAPDFPWGTALINVLGSFLIGLLTPFLPRLPDAAKPLLITGLLGGFTTMSGFALEFVQLGQERRFGSALAYWSLGAVACAVACAGGLALARLWGAGAEGAM